jgi:hypothetical protein
MTPRMLSPQNPRSQGGRPEVSSAGGVFLVRYPTETQMQPAAQAEWVATLQREGLQRPVGVVFVLGDAVQFVSTAVPAYWLEVTSAMRGQLVAMAMVTSSVMVRAAASGFRLTNVVRRIPLAVRSFEQETEALRWVREVVSLPRQG